MPDDLSMLRLLVCFSTSARHFLQATRAYLHAEKDVEAALQRAGFKVGALPMTTHFLSCR